MVLAISGRPVTCFRDVEDLIMRQPSGSATASASASASASRSGSNAATEVHCDAVQVRSLERSAKLHLTCALSASVALWQAYLGTGNSAERARAASTCCLMLVSSEKAYLQNEWLMLQCTLARPCCRHMPRRRNGKRWTQL